MENYIPDIYKKSIYDIDYKKLKKNGIKCILFDLDNTLITPASFPSKVSEPSKELKQLLSDLEKMKLKVIVCSNGLKPKTDKFGELSGLEVRSRAKKPSTSTLEEIMETHSLKQNEVILIGDQMYTDIKAGNDAGITTALVTPFSKKEFLMTKVNRIREKILMKKLARKDLFRVGKYYE